MSRIPYLLIADDAPDTLTMMEAATRLRGWRCETATSPEEIERAVNLRCDGPESERDCFDALVLDIHYKTAESRQTGISIVRPIRRRWPQLPIIFITAFTSMLVRNEALEVGQELITKPFDPAFVLDRVQSWIDWAGQHAYRGAERRKFGINRSHHYRRASDRRVEIAPAIRAVKAHHTTKGAG